MVFTCGGLVAGGRAVLASVSLSLAALSQTIKTGFMMLEVRMFTDVLDHHRNRYCRKIRVILQQVCYQNCPLLTCRYFLFSTNIFLLVIGGRCRVAGWQCLDVSVVTGLHKYNGIISGVFTTNWCILHTVHTILPTLSRSCCAKSAVTTIKPLMPLMDPTTSTPGPRAGCLLLY